MFPVENLQLFENAKNRCLMRARDPVEEQVEAGVQLEREVFQRKPVVVDFGDLHYLEEWIDQRLDHGIVLCQDDPLADQLKGLEQSGLLKITWVKSASCEGIAQFLFETFGPLVSEKTEGRAMLLSVHLEEDSKNSALFRSQSEK